MYDLFSVAHTAKNNGIYIKDYQPKKTALPIERHMNAAASMSRLSL
jgi:hypothetical protein